MAPSGSFSIPHEYSTSRKNDSLQSQVQQLVLQKGPFRNVTENSLLADIQRPKAADDHDEEQVGQAEGVTADSVQATREKLFQVRVEYLQMSSFIQNSLLTAIDAISASLAAHSRYATTAISSALQEAAPMGSIETKVIEPKAVSRLVVRRMNDVAVVTRAQAFKSAAAKLASASARLNTEAQHQSKYWDQLASLRRNGWPVSRVPNDAKTLVVHYGSAESSPQYRSRGVVALRQDENGVLTFPSQAAAQKSKILSVTVHRRGELTGRSVFKKQQWATRSELEDDLLQAREGLFQEELYNEASKEARLLANMGVKTRSSSIEFLISDECSVSVSHAKQPLDRSQESQQDNELADFVGNGLRLMLVAENQQKHSQRAKHKPPPMSPNPRPAAEYALLRPIIALLRHHCEIAPVLESLENYSMSLQLADLHVSVEHQPEHGSTSPAYALQALRRVVSSQIMIALPSKATLAIKVETHLASPRFGTRFSSIRYSGRCGTSLCAETSSYRDVVLFLGDVLCRDIGTLILGLREGTSYWQLNSTYPLKLLLAKGDESLASLSVACLNGCIAVACANLKDSFRERGEWSRLGARITRKDGQQEQNEQGMLEVVRSWTKNLVF